MYLSRCYLYCIRCRLKGAGAPGSPCRLRQCGSIHPTPKGVGFLQGFYNVTDNGVLSTHASASVARLRSFLVRCFSVWAETASNGRGEKARERGWMVLLQSHTHMGNRYMITGGAGFLGIN